MDRRHRQQWRQWRLVIIVAVSVGVVLPVAAGDRGATVRAAGPSDTTAFVPVGPVRVADTRRRNCGCRRLDASTIEIDATGHPSIPDDAVAVAATITATPATHGYITAYPSDQRRPTASTLNTRPDRVVANSAIVPLGDDGHLRVFGSGRGDVIVDVTGAFVPTPTSRAGRYVPLSSRRLVDTRRSPAPDGPLGARRELRVPLPSGVTSDAVAVVVNVTSVGKVPGHLSLRPAGTPLATTSFLNLDDSGTAVAASVIAPVSPDGFVIWSSGGGHVVVDVLGWFTGPSAAESTDGLFVPLDPSRALDTRRTAPRIHPGGTIEIRSPIADAAALATNVAAVRADRRGHVTAHPARTPLPPTSTVNPGFWNHTVANFAITTTSTHGVAYRSHAGTDLIVDVVGWFTGTPVAATGGPPVNEPTRSRVLMVGDSTLAALDLYADAQRAFVGFDPIVDAKSCRRLLRPSCLSAVTGVIPNTAVEAIMTTPGRLDIVVVKTGYNDWSSDFPSEFAAVVAAARAKGAHTILWQTYNEHVRPDRPRARRAYHENNVDVRRLAGAPGYSDVVLADWFGYSTPRELDWFWDGTHMTREGSWAQADYISRWIAAIEHRPCPRPGSPGQEGPDPCPAPDSVGPFANPVPRF
jgi:hypothetical protein